MKRYVKKIIKKCLKKADRIFFGGRLKKEYKRFAAIRGNNDGDHLFFKYNPHKIENLGISVEKSKLVQVPTRDFILMQFDDKLSEMYTRCDLAVRLMALEQYDGLNDYGIALDNELQERWTGRSWEKRFKSLICKIKKEGFDMNCVIEANRDMKLLDGTHRVSIAFHTNQEFIPVRVNDCEMVSLNTMDWFWGLGFTAEQCRLIEEKTKEMTAKAVYPFSCVLWSPARNYFDEITRELDAYCPDNISVESYKDIVLEEGELEQFIKAVYFLDDVTPENLKLKMEYNYHSSNITSNRFPIRLIKLNIKKPHYKIKSLSGLPQSREIIRCKEAFRKRYMDKVYDYKRDVIIHIADNYIQSKFIFTLLEINRDISDLFKRLNGEAEYVVIKGGTNQHSAFPHKFNFKTDTDILVKADMLERVSDIVYDYAVKHFKNDWVEIDRSESDEENGKIGVKLRGFSIFLFHIQVNPSDIKTEFLSECISNRVEGEIYTLPDKYETIIRMAEFLKYPEKMHHKKYVTEHGSSIDKELMKRAFSDERLNNAKSVFRLEE